MSLRALGLGILLGACAVAAHAAPQVSHAWIRWLPGNLPAAGYATIKNPSTTAVQLVSADSTGYASVMLHQSLQHDGVERMQMVDAMPIPAHGSAALAPGGYHLMLMQPKGKVAPSDVVPVRLHFSDGSTVAADFKVRPASAQDDTH